MTFVLALGFFSLDTREGCASICGIPFTYFCLVVNPVMIVTFAFPL